MRDKMPTGELVDSDELPTELPDLSGQWEWENFNHYSNGKVNVFFDKDVYTPGGWMGEIDNFNDSDGNEVWEIHIREILEAPERQSGTIPSEAPETTEQFGTLSDAISEVPAHIATHYEP